MSFRRNQRTKRSITVGGRQYFYVVTGEDYGVRLVVSLEWNGIKRISGSRLITGFPYQKDHVPVTPALVKQQIEEAIAAGWNPEERSGTWPPR